MFIDQLHGVQRKSSVTASQPATTERLVKCSESDLNVQVAGTHKGKFMLINTMYIRTYK